MNGPAKWLWTGLLGAGLMMSAGLELTRKESLSRWLGRHPEIGVIAALHFYGHRFPLVRRLCRFDPLSKAGDLIRQRGPQAATWGPFRSGVEES